MVAIGTKNPLRDDTTTERVHYRRHATGGVGAERILVASSFASSQNVSPGLLPVGFFRRLATLLLASTLVLILAGTALASIDATRPSFSSLQIGSADPTAPGSERSWIPSDLPDIALVVTGANLADIDRAVVPALASLPEITSIVTETMDNGRVSVLVALADNASDLTVDSIATTVEGALPGIQVSTGGRAVVDRDIVERVHNGLLIAVAPVIVLLALLVAAALGVRLGLAAAAVVALSSALGGVMGARAAGTLDGTLATTAIPAVLAALLVSVVLTFRLLDWFKQPRGTDHAETIRRSIKHLLPEVGLLFGGLAVVVAVMEFTSGGRSAATVVAVGAITATVVTLGALPAIMVALAPVPGADRFRLMRLPTPDGRDFPVPVLAVFACMLLGLGVVALRSPSDALLDGSALPSAEASRRVSEQLVQSGGDPTDAVVATIDASTSPLQLNQWAITVSAISTVGWVETSTGRYESGVRVQKSTVPARFATDDAFFAIVAPTVEGRSSAAQDLVRTIGRIPGLPTDASLAGIAVEAADVANSGAGGLWLLVALLALAGGVTAYVLLRDLFLAAVTVGLRLLGTGASIGVFYIAADSVAGTELQVLALIVNIGVGLFEIGFLRRIAIGKALAGSPMVLVGDALRHEGRAAMFGMGITALVGLGFLVSDIEVARRLGIAVAAGVVIELLIGTWLLRPVVLGERAAGVNIERTTSRRGLRAQALAIRGGSRPVELEIDPEWRRIVSGLLRSEFDCQAFPETADLETIFVEETPLFQEVADHNYRLLGTGLRVAGEPPIVKALTVVNTSSPVTLSVTVEHPLRYLVDPNGRQIGQRPPQIRDGMLWLVQDPSGRYRIAEAVDLGDSTRVDLTSPMHDRPPVDIAGRIRLNA